MSDTVTRAQGEAQRMDQLLREQGLLGCVKGQGYLYSKPLERNALVQWISARNDPR